MQGSILQPFFESAAIKYQRRANPEHFILDLLLLDTPHLFSVSSDGEHKSSAMDAFSRLLQRYIQSNNLESALCGQISTMLVSGLILSIMEMYANAIHQLI